jgi:hypothetical protein
MVKMSETEVKEHVKKVYSEIAQNQGSSGCGCGPSARDTDLKIGY